MFGRTWFAVLAGSAVLWGVSQIGQGLSPFDPPAGSDFFPVDSVAARRGTDAVAVCLEQVASFGASALVDVGAEAPVSMRSSSVMGSGHATS